MPSRLPAAGPPGALESSSPQARSSDDRVASAGPSSTYPGGDERVREVADAHANLTRGYLESEERFRQITEALDDVVWLTDERSEQLFFVNAAYEQIWGRSREELYTNPMAILDGVHPDDRERVRAAMVRQPHEGFEIEFRVLRPGGDQRWVWSRGFPVRNVKGEVYRIAGISEDVTERKQVVESHERLIRGFTHDVKNPLGAADGYLSLLEIGAFGEMSSKQTETVGRARRSIRAAIDLVGQLLEIERAEAGQVRIERDRVDIGVAARETVAEFRAAADAKHLDLVVAGPRHDDSAVVESDPARIRQILANLVSNAVKYTQEGGRIVVRTHVAEDHDAPWRGRWVAVTVSDNGPGIPLEKQHLLFREFTRFDPNAAEGSGIGLAISERLARALGAVITFQSTPGSGSVFTLWLPGDPLGRPAGDPEPA